ncbi:hypothetical protein OG596_07315 [Streptomyces sp. NBC_01102]|uniref:hypothetical protein n=1 Tax=unclassified Streptomyces TaxID=2593676 RepID=UPI00386DDFAD|nr:hypothetical protein OG596_07315 [Streptomyces sp. NBC_01102]
MASSFRTSGPHAATAWPVATRDVTLAVPEAGPSVGDLLAVLHSADPLVTGVDVVGVHTRTEDEGTRCITFRIAMSSRWRTVPRAEANGVVARAVAACEGWGATLRR